MPNLRKMSRKQYFNQYLLQLFSLLYIKSNLKHIFIVCICLYQCRGGLILFGKERRRKKTKNFKENNEGMLLLPDSETNYTAKLIVIELY